MARAFERVTLADAVGRLAPEMKVLLPPGCADPTALIIEIMRQADRLAPLTLMGGLRLDGYPFAAPAYAGKLRFATWHTSPRLHLAEARSEEHTSELQSRVDLVCRLLLEKKKK